MNILPLLFIAFIAFRNEFQTIHLKDFRCSLNHEKLHENSSCYTKPGNNNSTMLSLKIWARKPLNSLHLKAILHYKYETTFREIIHSPSVDWCNFVNSNALAARLFWIAMDLLKGDDKSLMHPCPYFDLVKKDIKIPMNRMIAIFPPGEYRLIVQTKGSDDEDILMANVTYVVIPTAKNPKNN